MPDEVKWIPISPIQSILREEIKRLDESARKRIEYNQALADQITKGSQYLWMASAVKRVTDLVPLPRVDSLASNIEVQKKALANFKQLSDASFAELQRINWRQMAAPMALAGMSISSMPQVEGYTPDDSDVKYVQKMSSKTVAPLMPTAAAVTGQPVTTEQQEAALVALATVPRAVPVSLSILSVEAIVKALSATPIPRLPPGMSAEEAMSIFGYQDLEKFKTDGMRELVIAAQERAKQIEMMRQGVANTDIEHLSSWEWLKMAATQPMLAATDLAEKYGEYWSRPLTGFAVGGIAKVLPGEQPWEAAQKKNYQTALASGKNWYMALGQSWDELEWNTWAKLGVEILFDPLTYVGWGLTSRVLRGVPYVGKFLAGINEGFIRMSDAPFMAAAKWWQRLPKTAGQEALQATNAATRDLFSSVLRNTGKAFIHQVTPDELRSAAAVGRTAYLTGGAEALETVGGAFGKWQLIGKHIELDDMTELLGKLGVDKADITLEQLLSVNQLFEATKLPHGAGIKFQRGLFTAEEATSRFLEMLGKVDATPEMRGAISQFLTSQTDDAIKYAGQVIFKSGSSTKQMIENFQSHVKDMIVAQHESPLYQRGVQHGLANAFFNRLEGFLKLPWLNKLDQAVVSPMARQYLLFLNYGPFNLLETIMRSCFRGTNMFHSLRGRAAPIRLIQAALGDVKNLPNDFVNASIRGEMWTMEATGKTALPKIAEGLKGLEHITPPGVIREVKTVFGKKVPLALRSINNANLWWAELQTQQRAWYMLNQSVKEMQRINPEMVKQVYGAIPDITAQALKGMTKGDLQDLQELVKYLSFRGPASVRANAQNLAGWELGKALKATDEMLGQVTGIDDAIKEVVRMGVDSGDALRNTDEFILNVAENLNEAELSKRLWAVKAYDEAAAEFAQIVPDSPEQFMNMLRYLQDAHMSNVQNISDIRGILAERGHQLRGLERDTLYKSVTEALEQYMTHTSADLSNMTATLRHYLEGTQVKITKETLQWGATVPEAVKIRIVERLDKLPANVKLNVKKIIIGKFDDPEVLAAYFSVQKTIQFAEHEVPAKYLYHEVMHSVQSEMMNRGDWSLIEACTDKATVASLRKDAAELVRQHPGTLDMEGRLYESNTFYHHLSEDISRAFEAHMLGSKYLKPEHQAVMEKFFPKNISQIKLEPDHAAAIRALADGWVSDNAEVQKVISAVNISRKRAVSKQISWDASHAEVEGIWTTYKQTVQRPMFDKQVMLMDKLAGLTMKPPTVVGELTPMHVAMLFRSTGDDLARSLFRGEVDMLKTKEQFIQEVSAKARAAAIRAGKSADQIGFGDDAIGKVYDRLIRSAGFQPGDVTIMTPKIAQLEDIRVGLHRIREVNALPDETAKVLNDWIEQAAKNLESVDMTEFNKLKEAGVEAARKQYMVDFTGYDAPNMFDGFMRMVFPFWSYESGRWPWLLRNFIQKPSTGVALGRYMDNTDGGYIRIPGTDLEFNPLRGTVFMGGFRRLYLKDFPEYYDGIPGMEAWDYISRFGFYPGIHVSLPWVIFGAKANRGAQFGEVLPAWANTALDAFLAAFPSSEPAKWLSEQIFPERFREYQIQLQLNKKGYDGLDMLVKKRTGIPFTEEEQAAWDSALGRISLISAMENQASMFRFRPKELNEVYEKSAQLYQELTGITPEQQDWVRRHAGITGKSLTDYIGGLTPIEQDMLYQTTGMQNWVKTAFALLPSAEQEKSSRVVNFWKDVEVKRDEAKSKFNDLDQLMLNGLLGKEPRITREQWRNQTGEMLASLAAAVDTLHASRYYSEVPVTYEQRVAAFEKQGRQPTFNPIQELLWMYYEIKPELVINPDTGVQEMDWDTYWMKTQAMLETIPEGKLREEFLANMQRDWTPLRKLWWNTQRGVIKNYRNVRTVYLNRLDPAERRLVESYLVEPDPEKRALMSEVKNAAGGGVISSFNATVRTARQSLRLLNPDLDAQLCFWGITSTMLSSQAEIIYKQIEQEVAGMGGGLRVPLIEEKLNVAKQEAPSIRIISDALTTLESARATHTDWKQQVKNFFGAGNPEGWDKAWTENYDRMIGVLRRLSRNPALVTEAEIMRTVTTLREDASLHELYNEYLKSQGKEPPADLWIKKFNDLADALERLQ